MCIIVEPLLHWDLYTTWTTFFFFLLFYFAFRSSFQSAPFMTILFPFSMCLCLCQFQSVCPSPFIFCTCLCLFVVFLFCFILSASQGDLELLLSSVWRCLQWIYYFTPSVFVFVFVFVFRLRFRVFFHHYCVFCCLTGWTSERARTSYERASFLIFSYFQLWVIFVSLSLFH